MSQEDAEPANPVDASQSDTSGDAPRTTDSAPKQPETTPETEVSDDPDGVLTSLTEVKQQQNQEDNPSADDKSKTEDPPKDDASKEAEKPAEEDFDHTSEFNEEELKNPERTKKRIEKLLAERKEDRPLADYAANLISQASKLGIRKNDLDAGINLMVGVLAGDPEADKRLVKFVTEQGIIKPSSAPAKVDLDKIRATVNRMKNVDFEISDDVAAKILSVLDDTEKESAPKQEQAKQKEEVPQKQVDYGRAMQEQLFQRAQANVAKKEASYQAKYPSEWNTIRKKAYEKIGEMEKKMQPDEVADVTLWPARLVEAVESVLSERSKSAAVRPSTPLRSTQPPAPVKTPEKGTEEYELGLLTGKYSEDDE